MESASVVKGQRLLGEPLGPGAHVLAHLAHLRREADATGRLFDTGEVVAAGAKDDLLHGQQVIPHVLLLVVRHHGEQGNRDARIQLVELYLRGANR